MQLIIISLWKRTQGTLPRAARAEASSDEDVAAAAETEAAAVQQEAETLLAPAEEKSLTLSYSAHVQSLGDIPAVKEGEFCGTQGMAKRLEGLTIYADAKGMTGGIEYRTHVQSYGWMNYVPGGSYSGTRGQAKRVEAIQIRLTGEWADNYDVYYRVYCQTYGWLDWAKNDEIAGSVGYAKRMEGIEIRLVKKGETFAGPQSNPNRILKGVIYKTHVQTYGWQESVENGALSGTVGQAKRLEGICISLCNMPYSGSITYSTHVQSYGWQNWVSDGAMSGTTGQAKRLEAIRIKLTGEMAEHYDVYYRVHAQTLGWLDWAKNGEEAGTAGFAKRLEGIEIRLVEKGAAAPGNTTLTFVNAADFNVTYSGHVQSYGEVSWRQNGATLGDPGAGKSVQGIQVKLDTGSLSGGIRYKVYSAKNGWQEAGDGNFAGTSGQGIALEAMEFRLYGNTSLMYDVYYRVHIKDRGWLGWAKNGQTAGSTVTGKEITGVEIKLINRSYGTNLYNADYFMENAKHGWYYENGYKLYYSNGKLVTDVSGIIGPQSSYLLQVNVTCNVVNVFASDGANGYIIPVKTFICSTSASFGATPLGTYHTQDKYRWHELMGPCWGQWCTRIVGGVLFHSVYYNSYCDNTALSVSAYNKLGQNASHGCVRLTSGDAKWIYDNCSLGTTVQIISSNNPGPFGKPSAYKLSSGHTWDPTDPNMYYLCQQRGCH